MMTWTRDALMCVFLVQVVLMPSITGGTTDPEGPCIVEGDGLGSFDVLDRTGNVYPVITVESKKAFPRFQACLSNHRQSGDGGGIQLRLSCLEIGEGRRSQQSGFHDTWPVGEAGSRSGDETMEFSLSDYSEPVGSSRRACSLAGSCFVAARRELDDTLRVVDVRDCALLARRVPTTPVVANRRSKPRTRGLLQRMPWLEASVIATGGASDMWTKLPFFQPPAPSSPKSSSSSAPGAGHGDTELQTNATAFAEKLFTAGYPDHHIHSDALVETIMAEFNSTDPYLHGVIHQAVGRLHGGLSQQAMLEVADSVTAQHYASKPHLTKPRVPFSVRHKDTPPTERHNRAQHQMVTVFAEAHSKVSSMLAAGVTSKEAFALIVDQIMNQMPEIILQLIINLVRGIFIELMGKILSILLPPLLIPNSGAIPPALPSLPLGKQIPAPPCRCKNKQGEEYTPKYSLIEEDNQASHDGARTTCRCEPGDTALVEETGQSTPPNVQPPQDQSSVSKSNSAQHSLSAVEVFARLKARGGGEPGPIQRIEPKVKDTVTAGLQAEALPALYDLLNTKLKASLEEMVPDALERGLIRQITTALEAELTSKITVRMVPALVAPVTKSIVPYITRSLVPVLTASLSTSIYHALSRDPRADYFCMYCTKFKRYCGECRAATTEHHTRDVEIAKLAHHFGIPYAQLYSGRTGAALVDEIIAQGEPPLPFILYNKGSSQAPQAAPSPDS